MISEWLVKGGNTYAAMPMAGIEPNYFTINGKFFPETETINVKKGQIVRPSLTGATVDLNADHTAMAGLTMSGLATEQEDGKYAITADFSMSGTWKITVYVRKEGLDVKKDFDLKIP